MKTNTFIFSTGAFAFATAAAIGGNMFQTTGWGKFPTHTIARPINGGCDCKTIYSGRVCTVTDNGVNPITVNAYDNLVNADAGGTIGLLRCIN